MHHAHQRWKPRNTRMCYSGKFTSPAARAWGWRVFAPWSRACSTPMAESTQAVGIRWASHLVELPQCRGLPAFGRLYENFVGRTPAVQGLPTSASRGQSQKTGSAIDLSTTRTSSASWLTGSGSLWRAIASACAARARSRRRCRSVGAGAAGAAGGAAGAVRQPSARHRSGHESMARISGF